MRPIKSRPLIDQEIEELDAFLLSDDGLENAMDVSGLDGVLCAVLSGPNVIMPSEWMRWVWDSTEGKQSPKFTSEKQAQRILDLLMRHANDCLRPPSSLLKRPRQACCATPVQDQKCWNTAAFEQSQFIDHTEENRKPRHERSGRPEQKCGLG